MFSARSLHLELTFVYQFIKTILPHSYHNVLISIFHAPRNQDTARALKVDSRIHRNKISYTVAIPSQFLCYDVKTDYSSVAIFVIGRFYFFSPSSTEILTRLHYLNGLLCCHTVVYKEVSIGNKSVLVTLFFVLDAFRSHEERLL